MASSLIYQLYIELDGFEPKIWRRFEIQADKSLANLAYIIMIMYEARQYYSYQFKVDEQKSYLIRHPEYVRRPERLLELNKKFNKDKYGITNKNNIYMYRNANDCFGELKDATKTLIKDVISFEKDEMDFFYDPEVNWKFNIKLEKKFKDSTRTKGDLPNVIEGKGYGIIETCSTIDKLQQFRENSKSKKWRRTCGYEFYYTIDNKDKVFKFDEFDVEDMNIRVKKISIALKKQYEDLIFAKSDYLIKILKRNYRVNRKK